MVWFILTWLLILTGLLFVVTFRHNGEIGWLKKKSRSIVKAQEELVKIFNRATTDKEEKEE